MNDFPHIEPLSVPGAGVHATIDVDRAARIAAMHAEWAAQQAEARKIHDPWAELRAIYEAARDLELRLGIVAWAFERSRYVEDASDVAGRVTDAIGDALLDVEQPEPTAAERRLDAIRAGQDARRKDVP